MSTIAPLSWGPALSLWFLDFPELERARASTMEAPFDLGCSITVLSRTDRVRRLGFFVWVPERERHCCHPRLAVLRWIQGIAALHGAHVEARTTCDPFDSERLPHPYTPRDARSLARMHLGGALVDPAQRSLLDVTRTFSARSLGLPPYDGFDVFARRGWERFLLVETYVRATSPAVVVDANGGVRRSVGAISEAIALGGWQGIALRESDAIKEEIYRRSWEEELTPVLP